MPDRWGRPIPEDWNQLTNQIMNFSALQQNAAKMREQKDININLSALQENSGSPKLIGNSLSQATARKLYSEDLQTQDQLQYRKVFTDVTNFMQKNPNVKVPDELYAGPMGQKVLVDLHKQVYESEEYKGAAAQKAMESASQLYDKVFLPMKDQINKDLSDGDVATAAEGIRALWRKTSRSVPYDLGEFDPTTQTFKKLYNDSQSDGLKPIGDVSLKEAMTLVNNMDKKNFYLQRAAHMAAVRKTNEENRMPENIQYATGPKGNKYMVIRQKSLDNALDLNLEVRDLKTNRKIIFTSYEDLYNAGFQMENLARDKEQGALQKQAFDIVKTAQDYQSGYREDQRKETMFAQGQQKFVNDQLKDIITTAVHYFGDPEADAKMTTLAVLNNRLGATPRDTSYTRALEFYEDNKHNAAQLQGVEAEKFKVAEQFLNATRQYFGSKNAQSNNNQTQAKSSTGSPQQQPQTPIKPYTGTTPPPGYPNATKAKDGKWWVKLENGKMGYIAE
jgi:hypothetical protein